MKDEKLLAEINFISGNIFIEFYYGKEKIKAGMDKVGIFATFFFFFSETV